jgi:type III secretion protein W
MKKKFVAMDVARQFMSLASERFLSADKIIATASKLGAQTTEERIQVITQMRDAVRQVSLHHIFRSVQHRDEMFGAILEALSDLEDQLEAEMEAEEEREELHFKTKDD